VLRTVLLAARLQAVEPGRVELAAAHVGVGKQVEQEAAIRGAILDHDGGLEQGPAQAGDRLLAIAADRDHLGDHRVELRRDAVARDQSGVDPHARPARQPQDADLAGRRREVERRILCVEARLDRVAPRGRWLALEAAPGGHVQLELDQVEARDHLGDRMLHLKPRVHLHEGEEALRGLVEEFDRRRPAIARLEHQSPGGLGDLSLLPLVEGRARRLLDHLLVAPLKAAVAHADRPGAAGAVGDRLHLDVAGVGDEALEQHGGIAEGLKRLRAGPLERLGQLAGLRHLPDPAPAAARAGLDHERIADALRLSDGVLEALNRPLPGRDRHAGTLREPLGADLVAQPPHGGGVGTHHHHSQALAEL
jgi:hypothetical protein